jgi:hypothetical protein
MKHHMKIMLKTVYAIPEYANGRGTLTKVAGSCPNVTPQFLPEMTRVAKPVFSVVVGCERKSSVENEKPGNALDGKTKI